MAVARPWVFSEWADGVSVGPNIYGSTALADIDARLAQLAGERGHRLDSLQSNAEYELVERVQAARRNSNGSSPGKDDTNSSR